MKLDVGQLIETIKQQLRADYAPPHTKRDAHPKMHGCVQAVLEVLEPSAVDAGGTADDVRAVRRGIFAPDAKREYLAWVRFSNAFQFQHDLEFETRGMAIKVLGADPDDPACHQDFLLATFDAFFLPGTDHYIEFFNAAHDSPAAVFRFFTRHHYYYGAYCLARSMFTTAMNPLAIAYSSQTPYHLGPDRYVKVRARPVLTSDLAAALPNVLWFWAKAVVANIGITGRELTGRAKADAEAWCDRYIEKHDFLRHAMMDFLASHDAMFDIDVQLWPEGGEPPDDGTYRWPASLPFYRVARLTIPRQVFWPVSGMPPHIAKETAAMVDLGEDMSLRPWHTIAEHEPFGSINHLRRKVYEAIATFRHDENRAGDPEAFLVREYDRLKPFVQVGLTEPT